MSAVIEHDFGKGLNESRRRFARLMNICEQAEAELARDPKPFLDRASDRICELERQLDAARNALRRPVQWRHEPEPPKYHRPDTISVLRDEYERLQACAAIVTGEAR